MAKTYKMTIAGCERELMLCEVNEHLDIAAFIMFGDIEITEKAAAALLKISPEHDVVITAEAKGIPLAHEMARQSRAPKYFVARKGPKNYMPDPICVEDESITTRGKQKLYLGRDDADMISGKRILIVDDVISTGGSLRAMEEMIRLCGGTVAGRVCVLAEGDAAKRDDIRFLGTIPLFNGKGEPLGE